MVEVAGPDTQKVSSETKQDFDSRVVVSHGAIFFLFGTFISSVREQDSVVLLTVVRHLIRNRLKQAVVKSA